MQLSGFKRLKKMNLNWDLLESQISDLIVQNSKIVAKCIYKDSYTRPNCEKDMHFADCDRTIICS